MIDFLVVVVILGCFYALIASGLNLQWGTAGIANLGVAGFFAVGAYVTALAMAPKSTGESTDQLVFRLGLPWLPSAVIAVVATALVGLLIGLLMSRVKLDPLYVAIVTLAFAQLLLLLLTTQKGIANGFNGVRDVHRPFSDLVSYFYYERYFVIVMIASTLLVVLFVRHIGRSAYGRTLRAIREDPELVESLGHDVKRIRLSVFVLGSALIGFAGALWAPYSTVVEPSAFAIDATFLALCIVIVGGSGNAYGPAIGALLLVCVIQEGSRFLPDGPLADIVPSLRGVLIGILLIVFVRIRPGGIVPEQPTRHTKVDAA